MKLRYVMGWPAVILSAGVLLVGVPVVGVIEGWSMLLFARVFWMPFVFLWGLKQIREYRMEVRDGRK